MNSNNIKCKHTSSWGTNNIEKIKQWQWKIQKEKRELNDKKIFLMKEALAKLE